MYDYQPTYLGAGTTMGTMGGGSMVATVNQKATPNFLPVEEMDYTTTLSQGTNNKTSSGKLRDFVADSGKIEDTLIAKGKLYDQKLEDAQEDALAREGLRPKPKITAMAKNIQRDTHIVKRLFGKEKERIELWNYKLEKDAMDEAKATSHWHQPQVNKTSEMIRARSTHGSRFSKDGLKRQLDEYSEKVKERERLHQERLREHVEQELVEQSNAPITTNRSTKLMTKKNERDNTRDLTHHEQMALRDQERMQKRMEKEMNADTQSFTPKITPFASNLYNNTTVQERMEMDVQAYQISRGLNQGTNGTVDIRVANPESTRRAAARSYGAKSQGAGQVRDSVYERTMMKQKQKELNIASARLEEERYLYNPSINAKSAAMTSNRQSIRGGAFPGGSHRTTGYTGQASDLLNGKVTGDTPTYMIRQQQFEERRQARMDDIKTQVNQLSR